jgi:uncharacterized protein
MDTTVSASPLAMTMPDPVAAPPVPKRARKKPRVWTPFAALIVAFVGATVFCELINGAITGYVYGAGEANGLEPAQIDEQLQAMFNGTFLGFALSIVPFQLFIGFIGVLAAVFSPVPFRQRVGLVKPSMPKLGWPATIFAPLPDLAIGVLIAVIVTLFVGVPEHAGMPEVTDPSAPVAVLVVMLISLLPAVFEEILFRGYFQRRLLERWSPVVAIGLSSLLFALVHADSLQHICAVLPGGIFYGIVAYRTKSIWPTIVMHALHNAYIGGIGHIESGLGTSLMGLVLMLSLLGIGVFLGLPSMLQLVVGRIPRNASATIAEALETAAALELPGDVDASAVRRSLADPAVGAPTRTPDAAPLTTLSA